MSNIKISIIVAVFNGAKTLQNCLDSIFSQTYPDKELIIIDGGSTDGTVEILKKNTDLISYWESQKDRGIAHAWNKALVRVSGDWIIFLGSDDRLHDTRVLSDMANFLRNDSENDIVYGQINIEGGKYDGSVLGGGFKHKVFKRRMNIPHTATFHRKKIFDDVGQFDESFKIAIDYELLLRKRPLFALFFERRISVMGGEGVSSRLIFETLREFRAAQMKNRVSSLPIIEFWYLYYQLRHQIDLQFSKWRNHV